MSGESKATFFRQSGWLAIATGLSGGFLIAVYPVLAKLPTSELGVYISLLRVFMLLGIASAGLQIVMAQDTAAAITEEDRLRLGRMLRSVAGGVFVLWLVMLAVCAMFRANIVETLKISNSAALWVTLGLALGQLLLPLVQGVVQGLQNFKWLGISILLNGAARFVAIAVAILLLKTQATGALVGALVGLSAAVLAGFWPARKLYGRAAGGFRWSEWLKRLVPLSAGVGSVLVVINADVVFIQAHFPSQQSTFYGAVAMVGVGLVTLTTPMAMVMFPKLVHSLAKGQKTDSFLLAMAGTALLGGFAALVCTIFPELPLRVLYFNRPEFWVSAQLVPWFMWCMLPVPVANVVVADLLAKRRFAVVPWLVIVAIAYCWSINYFLADVPKEDHFTAFKSVIRRLGFFSLLMLTVASLFRYLDARKAPESAGINPNV